MLIIIIRKKLRNCITIRIRILINIILTRIKINKLEILVLEYRSINKYSNKKRKENRNKIRIIGLYSLRQLIWSLIHNNLEKKEKKK